RWQHPDLGLLEASAFIDLVAESPLAMVLDLYVLRSAAATLALVTRGAEQRLYAPISARLIADVRAAQVLIEIFDAFRLLPHQVRLQIWRTVARTWVPSLTGALETLRDSGFVIAASGVDRAPDGPTIFELGIAEILLSRDRVAAARVEPDAHRELFDVVARSH